MASMLRDVGGEGAVNVDALKSEIRKALINQKANACPIAMRIAWHASGTYDKTDGSGGSDGATMRFEPEKSDPANAGLSIIRDLLHPVHLAHPEISRADLWTIAGCAAIEFLGGPRIAFNFGRKDAEESKCPAGRLPDATLGADHLREVFGRMGFGDKEIVALSGAHTLGRCHEVRSGFDGAWTSSPLKFDNEYFQNLLNKTWVPREWDGKFQYQDKETRKLMMLPTDLALRDDPGFRPFVEKYAADQEAWFKDFSEAYATLLSNGCPMRCKPDAPKPEETKEGKAGAEFRELAMHGSVGPAREVAKHCDVHALEKTSGRSALHKAAFWGHVKMVDYLCNECKLDLNVQDFSGDTALHDATKFGHMPVVEILLKAGAKVGIENKDGLTPLAIAIDHKHEDVAALLRSGKL